MTTSISTADFSSFYSLPAEVRREVETWMAELKTVRKPIAETLQGIAARLGCSRQTARRKYDAWRKEGWVGLINRSRIPAPEDQLPEAFIAELRRRAELNQRKSRPAFRQLIRDWHAGVAIPGYENVTDRSVRPKGWSESNLYRYLGSRFEMVSMRQGRAAAAPYRPQVLTTRVGLWVGSHYMFDDLWHDNFVVFGGKPVRVLELDALDVFSGCKFAWGAKPRFQRPDGTMDGLKEAQMRMLLASTLHQFGYSPRGTVLMAEHGTAAIAERIERLLFDRTRGVIKVERSGITGELQAVAGMFKGEGKGNFRFKSSLESLRNLFHNELAAIPGQTGMDPEHRPESTAGMLSYTDDILRVAAMLRPERAAMLKLPLLDYHGQFMPLLVEIYNRINERTWHDLEGWVEAGHRVVEYRVSASVDHWLPPAEFLALPPAEQAAVTALVRANAAAYSRTRNLSPMEVWRPGSAQLTRIQAPIVAEILGPDLAREERLVNGRFEFQDSTVSPAPLRYEGRVVDLDGRERELPEDTYQVFVNPFDLDSLFVHGARMNFIGTARRDRRVSRTDTEALQRAFGRVAAREKELLTDLRARHAGTTEAAIELRRHNADVIAGTTPENRAAERELNRRARAGRPEDILVDAGCADPAAHHPDEEPDNSIL